MAKKPRPAKFKQARRDAKNPAKRAFSGQSRAGLKDKDPRTKLNTIDSEALNEFKQSGKNRGMKTPSGEFVKMEGYQDMAEYKAKQRAENEAFRSKMRAEFGEYAGKKATKSDYDSNPKIKERAPKATPAKAAPKQTAAGKLRSAVTVNEQAPQSYKIDKAGNKIKEARSPLGERRFKQMEKAGINKKTASKILDTNKPAYNKGKKTFKVSGKSFSAGKELNAEGKAIYDNLIKEGVKPKSAMNKAIFRQEKGAKVAAKTAAPIAKAAKSAASAVKKQGPVTGKQMSKVAKVVSYDPKTKMGTSRPEGLTPEVRKEIQAKYDAAVRNESGMTARQEARLQRSGRKEDQRMSKLRAADPKKFDAREKLARNTKITPAQYAKERAKIGDTVRPKPAVAPKPNKYLNMQQAKKAASKPIVIRSSKTGLPITANKLTVGEKALKQIEAKSAKKVGIKTALKTAAIGAAKSTFDIVGPGKKFKVLKKVAGLAGGMKAVKIAKASAAAKPGTKVLAANAARKAANITKAEKAAKAGKMGKVKKVGLAAAGFYALDKIPLGGGSKKPASTIGPSTKRPEGMYPKGGGKGLKFGPNVSINAGGSTTSYTVKKGENLSKIAKEQGTTLAEIRKLNPIFNDKNNKYKNGNLIFSGTKVKLPTKK